MWECSITKGRASRSAQLLLRCCYCMEMLGCSEHLEVPGVLQVWEEHG